MEEQRKAVRAMQEYIKAHFAENITLADLAKASNFSPWYARNLFIKHLGLTPAVYIRRLRLSKSALRLQIPLERNAFSDFGGMTVPT